jgi:nitrogen fixation NifU-like protein
MMNDRLKALYKTEILRHSKNPFNEGEMEDASVRLEAYNPMCGDKYNLYLKVSGESITEVSFKGYGCAISKASTSVLLESIVGKTINEIPALIDLFQKMIDEENKSEPEELTDREDLLAFAAAREFPERKTCAGLSWDALNDWIRDHPSST